MKRKQPKVVFVVNVREDEEGDVSIVQDAIARAGVDAEAVFALSDLAVYAKRGECDIAVVDVSFDDVDGTVAAIAASAPGLLLASMSFRRPAAAKARPWASRHIKYASANQFAGELLALTKELGV